MEKVKSNDTELNVMTFFGKSKQIKDIKVGDILVGDDSNPRIVMDVSTGYDDMYEVTPTKGPSFFVNGDYVLCLKYSKNDGILFSLKRKKYIAKYLVLINGIPCIKSEGFSINNYGTKENAHCEAKKFYENLKDSKINHHDILEISVKKLMSIHVKIMSYFKLFKVGMNFDKQFKMTTSKKEIDIDPYFLGMWLGDGSSQKPEITTIDAEIINYLKIFAETFDLKLSKYKIHYNLVQKTGFSKGGNSLLNFLKDNDLIKNKHIPDHYKYSSRNDRLKLLAGLVDTDGHYDRKKKLV